LQMNQFTMKNTNETKELECMLPEFVFLVLFVDHFFPNDGKFGQMQSP
jgi:hypothetical protein